MVTVWNSFIRCADDVCNISWLLWIFREKIVLNLTAIVSKFIDLLDIPLKLPAEKCNVKTKLKFKWFGRDKHDDSYPYSISVVFGPQFPMIVVSQSLIIQYE